MYASGGCSGCAAQLLASSRVKISIRYRRRSLQLVAAGINSTRCDGDAGRCVEIKRLRRSIISSLRSGHLLVVKVCWHCIATVFSYKGLLGMFRSCLSLYDSAWNHTCVGAAIRRLTHPNSANSVVIFRHGEKFKWPPSCVILTFDPLDYTWVSEARRTSCAKFDYLFYLLSSGFAIYANEWTGESGFDYR